MTAYKVVVDGSNIATEGRSLPSLSQLDEAVRSFLDEHPGADVLVVVDSTFAHRIAPSEQPIFEAAYAAGESGDVSRAGTDDGRIAALEAQVRTLRDELDALRRVIKHSENRTTPQKIPSTEGNACHLFLTTQPPPTLTTRTLR